MYVALERKFNFQIEKERVYEITYTYEEIRIMAWTIGKHRIFTIYVTAYSFYRNYIFIYYFLPFFNIFNNVKTK